MRVLSGIQPSGKLHLGNYLGAIQQYQELQHQHECYFFIANFHSLTTVHDGEKLRQLTVGVAMDYLAAGLDPHKCLLFRQSDVPEVTELAWFLSTVIGKGLLERAHSYKDKVARGLDASAGLYYYPVLMAADILVYRSQLVPVGKDQVQHIEMTQDMAQSFNAAFGREVLLRPEPRLNVAQLVPGTDGQKMSKSYGNTIDIFEEPKTLRKKIMGIKTDSTPVEDPKNPDTCNVFQMYKLFATAEETAELDQRYRAGGMGYGDAKQQLHAVIERLVAPLREERAKLEKDPDTVEDILRTAGRKARETAQAVMDDVRAAAGIMVSR